jgi:Flp pilus assembly protein TadG
MQRCANQRRQSLRHGTTVVEVALVLPVFLLFVFCMVELSRAVFIQHVINSACRRAARLGSTEGNTTAIVKAKVTSILSSAVKPSAITVYVKDASTFDGSSPGTSSTALESMPDVEVGSAKSRTLFMVRAKIKYKDIALVKNIPIIGNFLDSLVLAGQAFVRHE